MRVLVCGGRDYKNAGRLWQILNGLAEVECVIEGGALGADRLAHFWAAEHGVKNETYEAYWEAHGRAAGPIRNKRMLTEGKPDIVIAFPGGKGTQNMIAQARAAGVPVRVIE